MKSTVTRTTRIGLADGDGACSRRGQVRGERERREGWLALCPSAGACRGMEELGNSVSFEKCRL